MEETTETQETEIGIINDTPPQHPINREPVLVCDGKCNGAMRVHSYIGRRDITRLHDWCFSKARPIIHRNAFVFQCKVCHHRRMFGEE